jgi:hypothetical protein
MFLPKEYIQQIADFNLEAGFFQTFSAGSLAWIFTGINKPGRQSPATPARVIHPPSQ